MISWTRKVVATGETTDAMGPHPNGYIAYHADGRMMALVISSQRVKLKEARPSNQEKIELFDSMLAYSATYTLTENEVIHHVDATWNPAFAGELRRPYTLEGDTLVISGAPGKDPVTGEEVLYRMEFRKV
jgi:hypothetical protein